MAADGEVSYETPQSIVEGLSLGRVASQGLQNFTAIVEYYEEYSSSLPFSNPLTSQTTLFASQQMQNIVASVRAPHEHLAAISVPIAPSPCVRGS